MDFAAAIASASAIVAQVPAGGMANGAPYVNTAMPSTAHIAPALVWPLAADGSNASLEAHLCAYAGVHLDAAARTAATAAGYIDIEAAVVIAVARSAAWNFFAWTDRSLNPIESSRSAAGAAAPTVHADHHASVMAALLQWAPVATRYMGLAVYNAISYETSNHHHLPAVTKKLASTTMSLSGLADWIAAVPARESQVFHDMFHPLTDVSKSILARDARSKAMLSGVKFDNLRKRVPVKAPDSGIAINYPVLVAKARSYRHTPEHLPAALDPPANVAVAIAAYTGATTAADLAAAVGTLRALSEALAEPSAYLAGFILGREAAAAQDNDMSIREARKTVTILGSPAYLRAAGEFSGTFAAGKESGYAKVAATVPDQVLPRCAAAMAVAASL